MSAALEQIEHRRLTCGIDLAVQPIPGRSVVAIEIRVLGGFAFDPPEYLGLAHVMEVALDKGTAKRDGRGLNDAFDEIGAAHASFAGRENVGFSCLCLSEFIGRAIELHAEMIRTPTFPDEACEVAIELTRQAQMALQDDPQDLARKLQHRQAYGEPLGRHVLGELETLERIGREQIVQHWQRHFSASRMMVGIAGAVDPDQTADILEKQFEGFGPNSNAAPAWFPLQFTPMRTHHPKELEQEQVAICFPGSAVTDDDFPIEQVTIGVLAGGMSGRLFTEVREKQGLVYWVGAWSDQPRRSGMVHLGASSTPQNVDQTFVTLLREIDRLGLDVTQHEVDRAITGIVARTRTQGNVTRAKANELVNDLFYYGRPIPTEDKLAKISAVSSTDIQGYLRNHRRDQLSVVTLGPKELNL